MTDLKNSVDWASYDPVAENRKLSGEIVKLINNTEEPKHYPPDSTEEFVAEQLDNGIHYIKKDLQQACAQELAKELDLINGGFYDFQEKAIRVIGSYLLDIVCDTTTNEDEKYTKIKELYEHNEMYRILGQYGLKHISLIKLIEKLKHHSYGLRREQIKLLETYGVPTHVRNIQLFIESQFRKMPATSLKEKQDLLYKTIEIASVYNMGVEENQQISQHEIELLVDSMSQLLYNVTIVEDDWKQMLMSIDLKDNRQRAVEHFGNNYVREMIHNEKIMMYSAKLDHFLQMMTMLSEEIRAISVAEMVEILNMKKGGNTDYHKAFAEFYGEVRRGLVKPDSDLFTQASKKLKWELKIEQRPLPHYASSLEDVFLDYRLSRCADRQLRTTKLASRNVYLQDLQSELSDRTTELVEQSALVMGVDEETTQRCKEMTQSNTVPMSNFLCSKLYLRKLLDFFGSYKFNPELLKEKFQLALQMLMPIETPEVVKSFRASERQESLQLKPDKYVSQKVKDRIQAQCEDIEKKGNFYFSEILLENGKKIRMINVCTGLNQYTLANSGALLDDENIDVSVTHFREFMYKLKTHEVKLASIPGDDPTKRNKNIVKVLNELPSEFSYDKEGKLLLAILNCDIRYERDKEMAFMRLAGQDRYGPFFTREFNKDAGKEFVSGKEVSVSIPKVTKNVQPGGRTMQFLYIDRRGLVETSDQEFSASLAFHVEPFALPKAIPEKVKKYESEWKEKVKEFKPSMLISSTNNALQVEKQYMNMDALIHAIDDWKQRYVSYCPLSTGEVLTYIHHPQLTKKHYYSPTQEDFMKNISSVNCDILLEGSIRFRYSDSKDYVRIKSKSLLGVHGKVINTNTLYDVIEEERVLPRKNYTKLFFQALEKKGVPPTMIAREDEKDLATIILKDLDIPERNQELKKRIEIQVVLYVLNQKQLFWYGDFIKEEVASSDDNIQILSTSPRGGGYFGPVGLHMLEVSKLPVTRSEEEMKDMALPIVFNF